MRSQNDPLHEKNFRFPREGGDVFCGCCLSISGELRTDKRGCPYIWCHTCRSRTFVGTDRGLTGVRVITQETLQHLHRIVTSLSEQAAPLTAETPAFEAAS